MIMSDDASSLNSGKKINIACSEKQTNKKNKTVVEKAFTRSVRFRTRGVRFTPGKNGYQSYLYRYSTKMKPQAIVS